MEIFITLPRLIGTRDAAARLLEVQNVGGDLSDLDVQILARNLSTSTMSFTDELLKQLCRRNPKSIVVRNPPAEFAQQVKLALRENGFKNVKVAPAN